ncbi:MAG: GNAT family N-acetyltransferase [Haloarculaceae archaeon]
MEFELLGWPPDGPKLRLDYREFRYAGKFVMTSTGKAVVRDGGDVVGAVAFDDDRVDTDALRVRYVTVRDDQRGRGIGPRLLAFVSERAGQRGYDRVRIAVNNPFAYEAAWKAGFGYTGERTGIAELVCQRPGDRSPERYRAGLDAYRERDLSAPETAFLDEREGADPPALVDAP